MRLQDQEKIRLENKPLNASLTMVEFMKSSQAYWYWLTEGVALTTTIVVLAIGGFYPLIYLRYALGAFFALWLPGYTFIRALFPANLRTKRKTEAISIVERAALSLGTSMALVSIVGMLLNYTPLGIRPTPLLLSLLASTSIFATVAVVREHMIFSEGQSIGR